MADDTDMGDWKVEDILGGADTGGFSGYNGTIDPSSMNNNFDFNDKSMENDFDFESAASSPSPFGVGPVDMESPEVPTIKYDPSGKGTPLMKKFKNHNKASSVSLYCR